MKLLRPIHLLPISLFAAVAVIHCGSESGGSDFAPDRDSGASGTSGTSGFTPTSCDGAPCPTDDDDEGGVTAVCGDGVLASTRGEGCDDGNANSGDGCSATCQLEGGFACPTPGLACVAARCGDGILVGTEECEFTGEAPPTGCGTDCKITPGYDCNGETKACAPVVCGDGKVERGESCEDGNDIPFDGCYKCQKEPQCSNGVCQAACGDGQKFAGEGCDDGNTRSGDGCSAECKIETGFACTDVAGQAPNAIDLPLLVRDFIGVDNQTGGATAHPDFNKRGGDGIRNIVLPNLDARGRMVLNCPGNDCTKNPGWSSDARPNITTRANFDEWYRNNDKNKLSLMVLSLKKQADDVTYVWDSGNVAHNPNANASPTFFDPIGTGGWVAEGKERQSENCTPRRNTSWTTETHFWFEYQGGEQFAFSGDDDTWVFINGRLALDLGGLHIPRNGTVSLAESGATFASDMPGAPSGPLDLQLTKGGIYEIVMFQAERNECGSNFKVTFKGFNKPRSQCVSTCGDGVRASDEVCDDGKNDGSYAGCMPGCKARGPRCGDGATQPGEECDDGNGINDDGCTNGCRRSVVR